MKKKSTALPKDRAGFFEGKLLLKTDNEKSLKQVGLYEKRLLSRMRYWCFRINTNIAKGVGLEGIPKGLKTFVEKLPGFTKWEAFGDKWDIVGGNPFMIVTRLMSIHQEWDHVMDRVAIPINASRAEVEARMEVLTREYQSKNK